MYGNTIVIPCQEEKLTNLRFVSFPYLSVLLGHQHPARQLHRQRVCGSAKTDVAGNKLAVGSEVNVNLALKQQIAQI